MILFENVTKKYRGTAKPALDRVDMNIDRGEFVFIVGASGSGKSSCLRLVLREDQPSSGKIHVLGQDLSKISSRKVPYFRRNLGTVFQDFRLLTNKTVYDNVAFSLQVIGKSRGFIQEAVPDTLEMVGLANKAKRFPHELSGGEQQRVAIARAIVNKPAILLADEPTGNLDPATSLGIMQLLRAINAAGTTVVMATHEAAFVDIMQQRVVELSQGAVVRDEVGGGYGETASIPVSDLSAQGVQVLRTTEAVVRAALSPQAAPETDSAEHVEAAVAAETAAIAMPAPQAPEAARPPAAGADEPAADTDTVVVPARSASVFEEPNPLGGEDDGVDEDTLRPDGPQERRIPGFLDPDRPDPVQMSETGSLAEHLGLNRKDDDQTDVGPVR
ncbi:cell division ATP-binding protein FtsE [Leucobacter allii]|uniref:Cell division ATP-binding protein FtsE n=1 Tax=Leucobacter allii TaxID=2932247 RepID=A0ABY4FPQ1_9MICO|nr:cell division ATP-binding protein FtsE [Leucobacter allii]UOQ58179.1 cell division ATP-binding protein FtsE [Leucobacter allii]UOR02761.1 cell division ATP-binding protein FtsE [Leucobacter allii]